MKKWRKALSVLASLAVLGTGFLASCSSDDGDTIIVKPNVSTEKSILITGHKSDRIVEGDTEQLSAKILPESAEGESISWKTSDEEAVSVTQEGLVTASTADREAQVWAEFADGTKSNIIKYQVVEELLEISKIELASEPSKVKYATGTELDLAGLSISVTYVGSKSGNTKTATVNYEDDAEHFTATGYDSTTAGKKTVTVTYSPSDYDYAEEADRDVQIEVTVINATVTSVAVKEDSASEYTFGQVIAPLNVTLIVKYASEEDTEETLDDEEISATASGVTIKSSDSEVTWSSIVSANDFASEDSVTKSLTFTYGGKTSDAFEVTINSVPVESITISAAGSTTSVEKGNTLAFTASVLPANATIQTVTWSVETETGATISTEGVLSAESVTKSGTVKVKAVSTKYDTISAQAEITIPKWITGISVTTNPTKTEYLAGGTLDTTGLVVTATYSDDSTAELSASDYTVDTTTLSEAAESKTVTVKLASDASKTATFTVKVLAVYKHEVDLSGDTKNDTDWWDNNYPYSGVDAQAHDNADDKGNKTRFVVKGTETDYSNYLAKGIWLQKGSSTLYRADNQAFFLDRAASSAVSEQAPLLIAAEVAGKYRIEVDMKATGSKNTARKIYIKTLEEDSSTADASTTKISVASGTELKTVYETTHESTNVKTITYEYTGGKPYSIVGIDLPEAEAVYITDIRLYTTQENLTEPSIEIHANSVSITASDGTVLSKTDDKDKTLTLKKGAGTFALKAVITPSASLEKTVKFALDPVDSNNKVSLTEAGELTVGEDISSDYEGTITATVEGTNPAITATLTLKVDASDTVMDDSTTVTLTSSASKIDPNGSVTLTATLSSTVSEKLTWVWKDGETELTGATSNGDSSTITVSNVTEGSHAYTVTVTGGTSNKSASASKTVTASKGASVYTLPMASIPTAAQSAGGTYAQIGSSIFYTDRYVATALPSGASDTAKSLGITLSEKCLRDSANVMSVSNNVVKEAIKFATDGSAITLTAYVGVVSNGSNIAPTIFTTAGKVSGLTVKIDDEEKESLSISDKKEIHKVEITIPASNAETEYYFGSTAHKAFCIYSLSVEF